MLTRALGILGVLTLIGLTASAYAQSPPAADPVMNEELMGRLIQFTRSTRANGSVSNKICQVFDLCDGTTDMPLKLIDSDLTTDGVHYFGLPLDVNSKDILIMRRRVAGGIEAFLTDKTGKLRAAAIEHGGVTHLITNERAAESFKAALTLFAKEAADLPPTGTDRR